MSPPRSSAGASAWNAERRRLAAAVGALHGLLRQASGRLRAQRQNRDALLDRLERQAHELRMGPIAPRSWGRGSPSPCGDATEPVSAAGVPDSVYTAAGAESGRAAAETESVFTAVGDDPEGDAWRSTWARHGDALAALPAERRRALLEVLAHGLLRSASQDGPTARSAPGCAAAAQQQHTDTVVQGYSCDGCGQRWLEFVRYACSVDTSYDLCCACYHAHAAAGAIEPSQFQRVRIPPELSGDPAARAPPQL
eukprot:TRINITY_DN3021_c1_g1_i1.p2 TRINITY_DN3021_c1_g1~~TRINITY_DN3021_c1_g1_i1.p2  ORF type:complete len:253 (+),score=58.80 TRINITY_DN3021_c1_g1_i1:777-1535(+)